MKHLPIPSIFAALLALGLAVRSAEPKFFSDDPLTREPETGDASGVQPWDVDLFYDLTYNLFVTAGRTPSNTRAQNANTVDEVPDSSWFTNRIGSRALSLDEILRGPVPGPPPDPSKWTIIREKTSGDAPGFTATDAAGQTWFISFDAPPNPDGATGALVIATKIFWALGYNQVEYFLSDLSIDRLSIGENATKRVLFVFLRPTILRTRTEIGQVSNARFQRLRSIEATPSSATDLLAEPRPIRKLPVEINGLY